MSLNFSGFSYDIARLQASAANSARGLIQKIIGLILERNLSETPMALASFYKQIALPIWRL